MCKDEYGKKLGGESLEREAEREDWLLDNQEKKGKVYHTHN